MTNDAVCAVNTNDAVAAVPSSDPVNDEADTAPIIFKDPVIPTLPVNTWVSDVKLPKRVEPVIKIIDEVIVCATKVFLTVKLSADEAVNAFVDQLEVPNKLPVKLVIVAGPVMVRVPDIAVDPVIIRDCLTSRLLAIPVLPEK